MPFAAALLAGILLSLSDQPLVLWPLQFVALIPLWWAAVRSREQGGSPARVGLVFAIGYATPLLMVAGLAAPILVTMAASLAQWTLLVWLAARLLPRGPIVGALVTAAAVTLFEVLVWYAVPMFGTAQCFVRPLSAAPKLVAFVAYTGVVGLVFVVVALQALVANALRGPTRMPPLLVATALAAITGALDAVRNARPLGPMTKVTVFGWNDRRPGQGRNMSEVYAGVLAAAAKAGSELLVTPETGATVGKDNRDAAIAKLGAICKEHGVAAAFGVWHGATSDNRIWFFDTEGALRGEYRKSHLIPWLEDYTAGDGTLVPLDLAGTRLGGMICQDDNFTDLARGYGRLGVRLMAVPTNDWAAIRGFHLENSIFRALENGYAIARAASGGISALVSPRGDAMQCDHVANDTPMSVTGDLELGDGEVTVYARFGDWPMVLLSAALLLFGVLFRRR